MPDSNLSPQEIFDNREEYGLEKSFEMLTDIIETDKDNGKRISAIKFLGRIIKLVPRLNNECFATLEDGIHSSICFTLFLIKNIF